MNARLPMSPDGRLAWQAVKVSDGMLYAPQGALGDNAARLAMQAPRGRMLSVPSRKKDDVFLLPEDMRQDVVVKELSSAHPEAGARTALSILRAHVMLEAGLAAVSQDTPWRIRSPKFLSALILDPTAERGAIRARFVMERATPDPQLDPVHHMSTLSSYTPPVKWGRRSQLPEVEDRIALYHRALEVHGGHDGMEVDWDEQYHNMILESAPVRHLFSQNIQGVAARIDINPTAGFDF